MLALSSVYAWSEARLSATRARAPAVECSEPTGDPVALERGRHLAGTHGCTACHREDLGGRLLLDEPLVARVAAPNLTGGRGGIGGVLELADWVRAVRTGRRRDGTALWGMPARQGLLRREPDLAAVIAWARGRPAVAHDLPARRIGLLGRVLLLAGRLPLLPDADDHEGPGGPPPSAALGSRLVDLYGCRACHGRDLAGGPIPGAPPDRPVPRDLTPAALGAWSEEDFLGALRHGRRPDGVALNPMMPWRFFRTLPERQLRSLWRYLRLVPPAGGGR